MGATKKLFDSIRESEEQEEINEIENFIYEEEK